jgi:hypothetical protein
MRKVSRTIATLIVCGLIPGAAVAQSQPAAGQNGDQQAAGTQIQSQQLSPELPWRRR